MGSEKENTSGSVMVVGAGIAGMLAAVDLEGVWERSRATRRSEARRGEAKRSENKVGQSSRSTR